MGRLAERQRLYCRQDRSGSCSQACKAAVKYSGIFVSQQLDTFVIFTLDFIELQ